MKKKKPVKIECWKAYVGLGIISAFVKGINNAIKK